MAAFVEDNSDNAHFGQFGVIAVDRFNHSSPCNTQMQTLNALLTVNAGPASFLVGDEFNEEYAQNIQKQRTTDCHRCSILAGNVSHKVIEGEGDANLLGASKKLVIEQDSFTIQELPTTQENLEFSTASLSKTILFECFKTVFSKFDGLSFSSVKEQFSNHAVKHLPLSSQESISMPNIRFHKKGKTIRNPKSPQSNPIMLRAVSILTFNSSPDNHKAATTFRHGLVQMLVVVPLDISSAALGAVLQVVGGVLLADVDLGQVKGVGGV